MVESRSISLFNHLLETEVLQRVVVRHVDGRALLGPGQQLPLPGRDGVVLRRRRQRRRGQIDDDFLSVVRGLVVLAGQVQ